LDAYEAIMSRRSIGAVTDEQPERADIQALLDAAVRAPTHHLTEPWRFYLIGPVTTAAVTELAVEIDAAAKGERAGEARRARLRAIPGFFVLTSQRADDPLVDRENYAACCCAAQNLMLYLWQRGVGAKWTTGKITRDPRFYDLVGIDAGKEVVAGFFWYGVPKVVPAQKRKEIVEIVTERP